MPENIIQIDQNLLETRLDRLVAEKVAELLNAMLDAEADEIANAAKYERTGERKAYRAGHYDRSLTAKAGRLALKVPKLKGAVFESAVTERYRRREESVEEALIDMYLAGVSTRQVDDISQLLWGGRMPSQTLSDKLKKVYGEIEAWRTRPLEDEYPYVFMDGVWRKRSWGGSVENVSVLVAIGVNAEGHREVIGVAEGMKEDRDSWEQFVRSMIERGLKGVRLVVGDRCAGLVATVGSMLPKARYQRCMVHFMRNVLSKTPPTHREWASAATWTCPGLMTTSREQTDHRAMDGNDPKYATFRTLPVLTSYHVDMSEDIKLNDLLHLTDEEISRTKIRFMTNYNGTEPIKVFRGDPDELNTDWLLSRKRNDNGKDAEHLHKGENVIGLVRLPENNDLWVLTCLKRIGDPLECPKEKSEDDDPHYVGYEGEELTEYRKFYGRVIVRYHKDAQQPIQYAEGLLDNLIVEKVLSSAEPL